MDDLLIRGGRVPDGTGSPGREANVAVAGAHITEVAPGSTRMAKREIDARGLSLATEDITRQGMPHPRFYGTHARVLGACVRDLRLFSLEQAIHKMTGGSATALGWTDRGWLKPGCFADVAVFDPDRIGDIATYEKPRRYATGMSTVVVNGEVVIDGWDHTRLLPGRVIRRPTMH